jgi:hypothetical protein
MNKTTPTSKCGSARKPALSGKKIGIVPAAEAKSASPQHYQFTDRQPLPGYQYYRLRQVDHNGSFLWSSTVSAYFSGTEQKLELWPNPGTGLLHVRLPQAAPAQWSLVTATGQVLPIQAPGEGQELQFDLSHLPPGIYLLQASLPSCVYSARWVKY